MKEIIYLDTKLVNSLLAQQNSGLITKLVNEDEESDARAEGSTEQTTTSSDVGLSALLKAAGSYSNTNVDSYNFVFSKSNKNLVETGHCTHKMRHKKTLLLKSGKLEIGVFCYGQKSIFIRN